MNGRLISYTRPIEIESLSAFARSMGGLDVFWQRGQYASAFAGIGAVYVAVGDGPERFAQVERAVRCVFHNPLHDSNAPAEVRPRFFGGFAFNSEPSADRFWTPFHGAYFILPRLMITRVGGFQWLTINDVFEGSDAERLAELRRVFDNIVERVVASADAAPRAAAQDRPQAVLLTERDEWRAMVERGVDMIHDGRLSKIVLARALEASFEAPVDPLAALEALEKTSPTAYRFLIRMRTGEAFFGGTPELLARLDEGGFYSHALAGSAPRGATPDEDDRLAAALMASGKDRHEHALVVEALRRQIAPLARSLDIPDAPVVTKLKHIQHLFTPVQAQLRERTPILRLVERLHPTPALGGDPQAESVAAIGEIEPVTRGWYGAPVGWFDGEGCGEFAVAIRSAVASGHDVRLYAGAGIVADSDPDKEWDETAAKFRTMMSALGLESAALVRPPVPVH